MHFEAAFVEGVFYIDHEMGGGLHIRSSKGVEKVSDLLQPLKDTKVQLALHYLPSMTPDRWGAGCCYWEPFGKCPAGHHNDPTFLLHFAESGILTLHEDKWSIQTDSSIKAVPFDLVEGHDARLVVVTDNSVWAGPLNFETFETMEKLEITAKAQRELLNRLYVEVNDFMDKERSKAGK